MIDDPNCACDLNIGCSGYLIEIPKLKNDDDDVIDDFSRSTSDVPDLRRTRRPPRPRRTRRPLQPTRPSRQTRPLRRTGRPTQDQDGTGAVDDDEVRIPLVTGDDQDTQDPLNIVSRDPRRTSTTKTSSFIIDDDEDRIPREALQRGFPHKSDCGSLALLVVAPFNRCANLRWTTTVKTSSYSHLAWEEVLIYDRPEEIKN